MVLHSNLARVALVLLSCLAIGCSRKNEVAVDENKPNQAPIACRLNALSREERGREGKLLEEHLSSFEQRSEKPDGFSYRYPSDPALFARIADLVSLEHRCCPFLDFHLEWRGSEDRPWLHVTGGARVKKFVSDTFGVSPEPSGAQDAGHDG